MHLFEDSIFLLFPDSCQSLDYTASRFFYSLFEDSIVRNDLCIVGPVPLCTPQLSEFKNLKWTFFAVQSDLRSSAVLCLTTGSHRRLVFYLSIDVSVFFVTHYLYMAPLTSVLAEQVRVSACISHQQHKFP